MTDQVWLPAGAGAKGQIAKTEAETTALLAPFHLKACAVAGYGAKTFINCGNHIIAIERLLVDLIVAEHFAAHGCREQFANGLVMTGVCGSHQFIFKRRRG